MGIKEQISEWIDAHEREYVQDVKRLVAIRSVRGEALDGKPFGEGPAAALEEAKKICASYGFAVKDYDGYVMTADMTPLMPGLDILAHLDVVNEGDGWDTDPYTPVEKDGVLYGRGTGDDKGPAVAALYAMRCIKELGIPMKKNVRLILGTDEECGSSDIRYYYSKEKPAPGTFSPDAMFPIFNTEKGRYNPSFKKSWQSESALPRVKSVDGGLAGNILPAKASAVVCGIPSDEVEKTCAAMADKLKIKYQISEQGGDVVINVTGVGAHASMPELGVNGITALIAILCALPLADCESTKALKQLEKLLPHGDREGKAIGVSMEDEISGKLTLAFTMFTLHETGLKGGLDGRVSVCATEENCKKVIEKNFNDNGFEVRGIMIPPHHTPEDSDFVQSLLKAYESVTGEKGQCFAMGGGTYVHDIEGGVAFGAGFPGFEGNAHGANEKARIADLLTAAKIYALSIYNICK